MSVSRPKSGLRKRIEAEDNPDGQPKPKIVSNFMFTDFKLPEFVPIDAELIDITQPNAISIIARKLLILEQNQKDINRAVQ